MTISTVNGFFNGEFPVHDDLDVAMREMPNSFIEPQSSSFTTSAVL